MARPDWQDDFPLGWKHWVLHSLRQGCVWTGAFEKTYTTCYLLPSMRQSKRSVYNTDCQRAPTFLGLSTFLGDHPALKILATERY